MEQKKNGVSIVNGRLTMEANIVARVIGVLHCCVLHCDVICVTTPSPSLLKRVCV